MLIIEQQRKLQNHRPKRKAHTPDVMCCQRVRVLIMLNILHLLSHIGLIPHFILSIVLESFIYKTGTSYIKMYCGLGMLW